MTIESTIKEIYAQDPAKISRDKVLLINPKKKFGHNRKDTAFYILVTEIFEEGGKVFVRGNHVPSNKPMVLDQRTMVIL